MDKHGLHTVPEKVRAIVEAPHPKTAQELTSFFGLLNYYKFIPNLASLIHPLNKLLKHGVKWELSESCVTAIEMAKDMFNFIPTVGAFQFQIAYYTRNRCFKLRVGGSIISCASTWN